MPASSEFIPSAEFPKYIFICITAPKIIKGTKAHTSKANFQPETNANAKHPTAVTIDDAIPPNLGPVAFGEREKNRFIFTKLYMGGV